MTKHVEKWKYRNFFPAYDGAPYDFAEDRFTDHVVLASFPESIETVATWLADLKRVRLALESVQRARHPIFKIRWDTPADEKQRAIAACATVWETAGRELFAIKDAVVQDDIDHPRGWSKCLTANELRDLVSYGRDLCGEGRSEKTRCHPEDDRHSWMWPRPHNGCVEHVTRLEDKLYKHLQLIDVQFRLGRLFSAPHPPGPPTLSRNEQIYRISTVAAADDLAIVVSIDRLTVVVFGEELPIGSEKAARYLKVLSGRPDSWVSSSDLERWDSTFKGTSVNLKSLLAQLPKVVRNAIETRPGKGAILSTRKLVAAQKPGRKVRGK